ncbi:hypothetical protein DXD97_02390 [Ruminococcus sp. TM10-9AT]|jgi:hypothetical protein|nr:hypothetical protein DXD97_02390 [Ruminococcus sp. TM10-9AT]DAK63040.1 MAG TPA: minor capsid protein [Caudoviricetes sp.]
MAKINDEYDIGAAFEAIENELIASMIRNMESHKQEELDEDKRWSMWQTEMLKSLEKYKHDNRKKYSKQFKDINAKISGLIQAARAEGNMNQEIAILKAIKDGFPAKKITKGATAEFFRLNDRKLEALIKATTDDMQKAETAILRMADDQYRKIIYNSQVYANTGAGTYEKAVDMATKDFLSAGLNCVEYSNGSRHTLADYADMAIRTACKRAYLQGEGEKRREWQIYTVIINKRGDNPCPLCVPFVGKVMIDDVWSGGPKDGKSPVTGVKYPLMSSAVTAGLYHPRCRDSHTTYFEGVSTPPDGKYTREELNNLAEKNQQEARQQYAQRQEKKFGRLADLSLDLENQQRYNQKQKEWQHVRMRTGNMNSQEYADERQKQIFFTPPKDITSEWTGTTRKSGAVIDLQDIVIDEKKYRVDGRYVLLDYSEHEKNVAEIVAKMYGKEVQMIPRVTYPQGVSTPDFKINGKGWDLKTISTDGKNVLYNAIKKKKRQAGSFIFDVTDCPLEEDEIIVQVNNLFRSTHLSFLEEVALYKDEKIIGVYQRNKK